MTPIFYVFANILGGRQYFLILLDFVAANINGCPYAGNIFTFKIGFTALMFFTLKIK